MLTDAQARKAKPLEKDYKLADEKGLYLFVTRAGAKIWRMKYRFGGAEKRLIFGAYPEVSLAEARDRRDEARRQLRDHLDPAIERKKNRSASAARALLTFEKVARDWQKTQTPRWSPAYGDLVLRALERDVFPAIGAMPLADIDAPMVLDLLRKIERRGSIETAKRVRQHVSAVFVWGISEGIVRDDPAALVGKALKPKPKPVKQPALTDLAKVRQVLIDAEASTAGPLVKLASRLLALTAVRPGIVRRAVWGEFEDRLDGTSVAGQGCTMARAGSSYEVGAGPQRRGCVRPSRAAPPEAVDVLRAVRRLTGRNELLFPSVRHLRKPMSENTIGYMYNRAGYQGRHVPHGWRAAFSTIMNERAVTAQRADDRAVIDLMLAHVPQGLSGSEAAYNRAQHMPRRRELATEWAELLLGGLVSAAALVGDGDR